MWLFKRQSGIVNVRMVITEEKILSNIDKVQKMINPNSKKQIVQLEEDGYFKDLIESIKTYLIEYPKKKNFPSSVYRAAYGLVEYATNQFEENTKKIEELIRRREDNITLAGKLKSVIEVVENKEKSWKNTIKDAEKDFSEDIIDTLNIIGKCKTKTSQNYQDAMKLLNARVNNLESNLYIEIDMERIEDRSKALSYIGIEVADALKAIPAPINMFEETTSTATNTTTVTTSSTETTKATTAKNSIITTNNSTPEVPTTNAVEEYLEDITFEAKPSLWERVKNTKLVRAISYVMKIRVRVELPNALPEGRGENQ